MCSFAFKDLPEIAKEDMFTSKDFEESLPQYKAPVEQFIYSITECLYYLWKGKTNFPQFVNSMKGKFHEKFK